MAEIRKKKARVPWRARITRALAGGLRDRAQLLELLTESQRRGMLDIDALGMLEGALAVADMQVRDIMVPRAQMDCVDVDEPIDRMVERVVAATHSRFPVIGENKDDVIGILLAKDMLRYFAGREFDLRRMLRPVVFVPESKRLNVLLREFRVSRNHMAVVVDEYGGVAGLVTIEDVLEQIVGDIEDEYDFDETSDNIKLDQAGRYRVKATTEIEDFNAAFGTAFSDDGCDTVGGLVIHHLGRLPKRGEVILLDGLRMSVLRADSRRVHTLLVDRPTRQSNDGTNPGADNKSGA